MLAQIVGQVDINSAAVICIAFISLCVIITTMIGKRRGKRELEMQFEIDKEKLTNEDKNADRQNRRALEVELGRMGLERDVQFKRIESGLIEGKAN